MTATAPRFSLKEKLLMNNPKSTRGSRKIAELCGFPEYLIEYVYIRRIHPGRLARSSGAWVWELRCLSDDRMLNIGSPDGVRDCIKEPELIEFLDGRLHDRIFRMKP